MNIYHITWFFCFSMLMTFPSHASFQDDVGTFLTTLKKPTQDLSVQEKQQINSYFALLKDRLSPHKIDSETFWKELTGFPAAKKIEFISQLAEERDDPTVFLGMARHFEGLDALPLSVPTEKIDPKRLLKWKLYGLRQKQTCDIDLSRAFYQIYAKKVLESEEAQRVQYHLLELTSNLLDKAHGYAKIYKADHKQEGIQDAFKALYASIAQENKPYGYTNTTFKFKLFEQTLIFVRDYQEIGYLALYLKQVLNTEITPSSESSKTLDEIALRLSPTLQLQLIEIIDNRQHTNSNNSYLEHLKKKLEAKFNTS